MREQTGNLRISLNDFQITVAGFPKSDALNLRMIGENLRPRAASHPNDEDFFRVRMNRRNKVGTNQHALWFQFCVDHPIVNTVAVNVAIGSDRDHAMSALDDLCEAI